MVWIGSGLVLAVLSVHPGLNIQPVRAHPGDPVLITLRGSMAEASGTLGKQALRFYPIARGYQAIAALSVDEPPGKMEVEVKTHPAQGSTTATRRGTLVVLPPEFPKHQLTVDNKFVEKPSPEVERWIHEDHAAFADAFHQAFGPPLFKRDFAWPRPPRVTASFGELRLFNGKKNSQHFGLDLKAKMGEPIRASNDGVVVMARSCYASGNTVILYHGGELFTLYLHLSRMDVKVGQRVSMGQRLGLAGKTGRVTGPHLHWAAKVEDRYVNPETLIRLHFSVPVPK